jgi:DNA-binding MarR family transcriptional regulator
MLHKLKICVKISQKAKEENTMPVEQWVTMSEAAKELQIPVSKISRLAASNVIEVRQNKVDRRLRLVNLTEIRELLK